MDRCDLDPPIGGMAGITVVLLNGPPRSGKDTAGNYCAKRIGSSKVAKFAGSLKHSTHVDFGMPNIPDDYFETCKDVPSEAFFGRSPRQAYIEKSELRTKPFLGGDHYGRVLLRHLWLDYQNGFRTFFVTDSGFASEAAPVIRVVGEENVLLVRIHAEDRGVSFAGDSRSYIELPSIPTYDVANNRGIEEFCCRLMLLAATFITDRTLFNTPVFAPA